VEINRRFDRGPITFISSTLSIRQRENPHFDTRDTRRGLAGRAERSFAGLFRLGVSGSWDHVAFAELDERFTTWGADAAFDTRRNTDLPRNAVYLFGRWERLNVEHTSAIDRYRTDARGYIGLPRGSVVALRVLRTDASAQLPAYEQPLLGGFSSVRGFRTGYRAGDTLVTATAELRYPLTSPVSFGSAGATLFVDRGTTYADGTKIRDADFLTGVGGGLYFSAAFFKLNMDLARGLGRGWRLHVSSGFQF
jgi:outer membrane protein assembly factor BamA